MKKLILRKGLGKKGGQNERGATRRSFMKAAGASLLLMGCGGGNDNKNDAGQNDSQTCPTPGIGSEHIGSTTDYQMAALGVTQRVIESLTPVDCVDHVSAEQTTFVQSNGTQLLPNDDLTRGKLAIHRNVVTVFGNEHDLQVNRDFDEVRLCNHNVESFEEGKIFSIPSPEGDMTWEVRAINQTTETVAGKQITKVTFEVMNSPDRTPEQTRKDVYIVTDPDDYVPVYDAVTPTGARGNHFSLTARNLSPSELEQVRGKLWVDPSNNAVSLAVEQSGFDLVPCGSACGTLPYADTGREVTLQGIGVTSNSDGLVGFTLTTGFFLP